MIDGTIDFFSASCEIDYSKPIYIRSEGGSGYDALEIAEKVKENNTEVYVFGGCSSSCTVIAVAGSTTYARAGAGFGVHSANFTKLTSDIYDFYVENGLQEIADIMINTPHGELYSMSSYEAKYYGMFDEFYY